MWTDGKSLYRQLKTKDRSFQLVKIKEENKPKKEKSETLFTKLNQDEDIL